MNRKTLLGSLVFVLSLGWVGAALAYQVEFTYGPRANYALAYSEHYYGLNQSTDVWNSDESQGTATAETWSPAQGPSAIARAVASPIGAGPVATVNLQVTERTSSYSYAYGWADTIGNFTIIKEPGDIADQVLIELAFRVAGIFNLHTGAFYTYAYSFSLDGVERHSGADYMGGPPTLDDLFITSLVLGVGLPHTFNVSLEGSLSHNTFVLDTVLYQASLDVHVQQTPLPPSLLLLGSGLLGLGFCGWRARRS